MPKITVIGLGPGNLDTLSLGAWELLQRADRRYFRTRVHPAAEDIAKRGLSFESFDDLYDRADSFDEVYRDIVNGLLLAAKDGDILYAVPGHPLMAEQTVQLLLEKAKEMADVEVDIGPGQSFLDAVCRLVHVDPIEGFQLLDGTALNASLLNPYLHTFIAQVYSAEIAADVKLTLMEVYPDDYAISVVRAAGVPSVERVVEIPLYELDRIPWIDHLTTVCIKSSTDWLTNRRHAATVAHLARVLREPGGCPWDQKQTHASLRRYVLEEAYEVVDRIDHDDSDGLADELGDLLLQILLHAQIATEEGEFALGDVYAALTEKLIRRHPHVFGDASASTEDEAEARWYQSKAAEQPDEKVPRLVKRVKRAQPPFQYALGLQDAAKDVGMDWDSVGPVLSKLREELDELETALQAGATDEAAQELGDILFTAVNVARWMGVDPERALRDSAGKFEQRLSAIEDEILANHGRFEDYTSQELDMLWRKAKQAETDKLLD